MMHILEDTENSKRAQMAVVEQDCEQRMTQDLKLDDSIFANKDVICTSQTSSPYISVYLLAREECHDKLCEVQCIYDLP